MAPAIGEPTSSPSAAAPPARATEAESEEVVSFRRQVEGLASKADLLEKRVNEVVDFHDGKKQHGSGGRKAAGGGRSGGRDGGHSKGKPDLFRQIAAILREIISKPMDFSTIRDKMEGKGINKYNNVREICSDVRLIFSNAMRYNAEGHPVHRMAKTLLEIFEQKWLRLLPKVESEEKRQKEEGSTDITGTNSSREAAVAKLAKETDDELSEINKELKELYETVVQRCRKMTADEKRKLGASLCHLSPDDLEKALEIVAEDNPDFQTKAEEVELDMDALSETTLWRIKFFVREALLPANIVSGKMIENAKRDACTTLTKSALKRIKKQP
ncbi:hypothetical protein PR202_gb17972 [Eleusine coracana subsp. coracana]|uniref:Transcription factor GTE1 n=1 Tax=Eleusine coracana subsp. coracana TaxID=191504 RepID=A0AAV5F471_ELECO|nr:hypothetical protein PR202_gb17972 [Eleusine coracana subsp. coracana]